MRLLELSITNLGPFVATHSVQFRDASGPLPTFAITGATGAGKSTILNSISLALYGRTSKKNLNAADYISQGHDEGEIHLSFEHGLKTYRVHWKCKIKKDSGEQLKNPVIQRVVYEDERVSNKSCQDILGLTFEQFSQTVILGQGEFARFLKAPAHERGTLLEDITHSQAMLHTHKILAKSIKEIEERIKIIELSEKSIFLISDQAYEKYYHQQPQALQRAQNLKSSLELLKKLSAKIKEFQTLRSSLATQDKDIQKTYAEIGPLRLDCNRKQSELETIIKAMQEQKQTYQGLKGEQNRLIQYQLEMNQQEAQKSELWRQLNQQWQKRHDNRQSRKIFKNKKKIIRQLLQGHDYLNHTYYRPGFEEFNSHINMLEHLESEARSTFKLLRSLIAKEKSLTLKASKLEQGLKKIEHGICKNQQKLDVLYLQEENLKLKNTISSLRRQGLNDGQCPICQVPIAPYDHKHPLLQDAPENVTNQHSIRQIERKIELSKGIHDKLFFQKEYLITSGKKLSAYRNELQERCFKSCHRFELILKECLAKGDILSSIRQHSLPLGGAQTDDLNNYMASILNLYYGVRIEKKRFIRGHKIWQELQHFQVATSPQSLTPSIAKLQQQFCSSSNSFKLSKSKWHKLSYEIKQHCDLQPDLMGVKWKTAQKDLYEWQRKRDVKISALGLQKEKREETDTFSRVYWHEILELARHLHDFPPCQFEAATQTMFAPVLANLVALKTDDFSNVFEQPFFLEILDFICTHGLLPVTQKVQEEYLELETKCHELKFSISKYEEKKDEHDILAQGKSALLEKLQRQKLLQDAMGKGEFRSFCLHNIERTLFVAANRILMQLCDGRYEFSLSPAINSSSIIIYDRLYPQEARKVSGLSGGETFLLGLALALALSEVARGQTEIESFFIDEGFGTLDEDAMEDALLTLHNLEAQGKQIGIISHIKTLTERFPHQITVNKRGQGISSIQQFPHMS